MAHAIRITSRAIKQDMQFGPALCICVSIVKGIMVIILVDNNYELLQIPGESQNVHALPTVFHVCVWDFTSLITSFKICAIEKSQFVLSSFSSDGLIF